MSAEIQQWYQGVLQKNREEGRVDGERRMLLRMLRARFGELPEAAVARIEAAETDELERWSDRMLSAQTLAEVLGDAQGALEIEPLLAR